MRCRRQRPSGPLHCRSLAAPDSRMSRGRGAPGPAVLPPNAVPSATANRIRSTLLLVAPAPRARLRLSPPLVTAPGSRRGRGRVRIGQPPARRAGHAPATARRPRRRRRRDHRRFLAGVAEVEETLLAPRPRSGRRRVVLRAQQGPPLAHPERRAPLQGRAAAVRRQGRRLAPPNASPVDQLRNHRRPSQTSGTL